MIAPAPLSRDHAKAASELRRAFRHTAAREFGRAHVRALIRRERQAAKAALRRELAA